MICIQEAILVEGRYDKNALSQIVKTAIFETNGFGIMKDHDKIRFLRMVAENRGLIVLTDSDGAGLLIRNKLKGLLPEGKVLQAYIPDIPGKEKRKRTAGKAGLLGVEGMPPDILEQAIRNCGAHIIGEAEAAHVQTITKQDLYKLGLSGKPDSAYKRQIIKEKFQLPQNLGSNAFLDALNLITTLEDLETIV